MRQAGLGPRVAPPPVERAGFFASGADFVNLRRLANAHVLLSSSARAVSRLVRLGSFSLEAMGETRVRTRHFNDGEKRRAQAGALCRLARELCRVHGLELAIEGILPDGPAVFIANHVSYIDALVLAALAPSAPIAKAEVASWPVFGASARSLGVLLVQRGDAWSGARALRSALRSLDAGVSVLGFPEGTTTHGGAPLPFHRGLFGVAARAGVPVVPIALAYEDPELAWVGDEWFLPHYLRTAMRPTTAVSVRLGAPLFAGGARPEHFAARAREKITRLLERR